MTLSPKQNDLIKQMQLNAALTLMEGLIDQGIGLSKDGKMLTKDEFTKDEFTKALAKAMERII